MGYQALRDPTYASVNSGTDSPKLILQLVEREREKVTTAIPGLKLSRKNGATTSAKKLRLWSQDVIGGGRYAYIARAKAFVAGRDPETCTGTSAIVKMYDLYNLKVVSRYKTEVAMQVIILSLESRPFHSLIFIHAFFVPTYYSDTTVYPPSEVSTSHDYT